LRSATGSEAGIARTLVIRRTLLLLAGLRWLLLLGQALGVHVGGRAHGGVAGRASAGEAGVLLLNLLDVGVRQRLLTVESGRTRARRNARLLGGDLLVACLHGGVLPGLCNRLSASAFGQYADRLACISATVEAAEETAGAEPPAAPF
jgi:hypothetical protein